MALGYAGETCAEAVRLSIDPGEVLRYSVLRERVAAKGAWRVATIRRHLMSCIVNLPPARFEWESREPFLFIRPDGRYELHDPAKHPAVID